MVIVKTSSLRAEQAAQTRRRILEAASEVFDADGFAGTRIEDVAVRAGVAVPTVYKVFTNKRNLLLETLNRAMTGGETGTVAQQSWWTEQLEEPDPDRQLALVARNARRIHERAGTMLEVVRAAAPLDDDLADVWAQVTTDRRARSAKTAKRLVAKAGKRARLTTAETALTLLSLTGPELFTAHADAGRTPRQYETWLSHVLRSSLLTQ